MQPIFILVFLALFAVVALLIAAFTAPRTENQTKKVLTAALKLPSFGSRNEVADVRKEHRFSAIPWLNTLLAKMNISLDVRRLLIQSDLNWTPGKLLLYSVGALVATTYVIAWKTDSVVFGLVVGSAAAAAPVFYVLRKRRNRLTAIQQRLPEALDLMVSALRAGQSMGGALGTAAREAPEPVRREFRLCFEEQNFGIDLRTATENLLARAPLTDLHIVTTAMLINKESGGNLAEVLDKTSVVIRERFRLQQQIQVHTAQGRLTGTVLMLLPFAMALVIYFDNPKYIDLLFSRELGHRMLEIAAGMNLIGWLIIRKIVNINV